MWNGCVGHEISRGAESSKKEQKATPSRKGVVISLFTVYNPVPSGSGPYSREPGGQESDIVVMINCTTDIPLNSLRDYIIYRFNPQASLRIENNLCSRTSLDLPNTLQPQVDIRTPAVQTLYRNAAAEVFSIRPTERQPVTQSCDGAGAPVRRRDDAQRVVAAAVAREIIFLVERGEAVTPDIRQHFRGNTAAAVPNTDRHAWRVIVKWLDSIDLESTLVLGRWVQSHSWRPSIRWLRRDGNDYGLAVLAVLYSSTEGVFEQLRRNVLEMHGHKGEGSVGLAIDDPMRTHAILKLADVSHEASARIDNGGWREGRVDDTDVARMFNARSRASGRVEVRCTTIV